MTPCGFVSARESKQDICAVRLNEFKDDDGVRVLPVCTHKFHVSCIDKWLDSHRNCPLCRTDIMPPSDHLVITLSVLVVNRRSFNFGE